MKKCVLFSAFLIFALIGNANAVVYDFNSLSEGIYSESDFNKLFDGVYFENNGGSFRTVGSNSDLHIDDIGGGLRQEIIRWEPYYSTIATFDNLTDYVSITNIGHNPHSVWFFMRVFDTDHNLLSQIEKIYSPTVTELGFISKSYILDYGSNLANIASVEFWSDDGNYTQGDGYWDNFTFNLQPIPEPNTMILLGIGLVGLAGSKKEKTLNE